MLIDRLRFRHNLDSGVRLDITVNGMDSVVWHFQYHGRFREDPENDPNNFDLVVRYDLRVGYTNGVLDTNGVGLANEGRGLDLTIHVVLPKKRGIKFAYGADVSPGSEALFEFFYVPAKNPVRLDIAPDRPVKALRLAEVFGGEMGKRQTIKVPEPEEGSLVRPRVPVDIPFPLHDVVTPRHPGGPYRIPYLRYERNTIDYFEFPESILAEG